ncbi:MAG: hypothetical protein OXU64_02750 [Gemmatimonadota bacterium]|nr:hypothetical protein [Gemmatimonadota bacterium]
MNRRRIGCLLWLIVALVVVLALAQFWPDDDDPRVIRGTVPCDTPVTEAVQILDTLDVPFEAWVEACN